MQWPLCNFFACSRVALCLYVHGIVDVGTLYDNDCRLSVFLTVHASIRSYSNSLTRKKIPNEILYLIYVHTAVDSQLFI